ncbi:uncharacterized protein LOC111360569 [Spodoptera litura]|uniref:Uncharacterized protein LOC111360569 n=1 Tax=Spodoptera litura TaxID=69820 RepID=A0A9J7EKU2_SPOLT|nr:uncharacterized protein LOC111360569 [Spodoptera litura]
MFKIESYVTPILLSYVDKYVRDFKPADAQVSLWGGGVALHNLVLKADVLQQEVALPFTLVSGRIHELLIQVPWTKIMSEPIVVTIDTIECVLSLNPPVPPDGTPPPASPSRKTQVVEAPPGYMQALVRRIVSNIALRVHHLIVKYVQDDIVLSLNVKHLGVDSAGPNWEPAFADIDQAQPVIRRLVHLDDLTLCLDKSDGDGKIRFFQEPLLYRCQLDLRVLTRLISANTRRATSLNVQLRSSKLAWSVTNEQLALLLRLIKERPITTVTPPPPKASVAQTPLHSTSSNSAEPTRQESWSEWAWSWLPTWVDRDTGLEEAPLPPTSLPIYFSAYLDDVSLVFKVMETETGSRKRSRAVLEVSASFAALKTSICHPTHLRIRCGARELMMQSHGRCVCGHVNFNTLNSEPTVYLKKIKTASQMETVWTWPEGVLNDKVKVAEVIDENPPATTAGEPEGSTVSPTPSVQDMKPTSVEPSLDKQDRDDIDELWNKMAPLLFVEYVHERSPPHQLMNPYDNPPRDFEYSDWGEECSMTVAVEPLELRICMGLIHRLQALKNIYKEHAASEPELPKRVLTVEEKEALTENLPQRRIKLEVMGAMVRLIPWNHIVGDRQPTPEPVVLEIELPYASAIIMAPLYPHRVCSAASQMPKDSGSLWQGARRHTTVTLNSVQIRLTNADGTENRPCARADIKLVTHQLLYKSFFQNRDSIEFAYHLKIKEMSICGSFARLQAAYHVPTSLTIEKRSIALKHTTLPRDALHDQDAVAIDLALEDGTIRGYMTDNVNMHVVTLHSAKATALHEPKAGVMKQAWLFSAPDAPTTTPCLRFAVQWCTTPVENSFDYLGVWTEPVAFSVDPLLIAWLAYKPTVKSEASLPAAMKSLSQTQQTSLRRRSTPPSSSGRGGSRAGSAQGAELIHFRSRSLGSSSEPSEKKDKVTVHKIIPQVTSQQQAAIAAGERVTELYRRLQGMVLNVELGLALVYVTMSTASAVDCHTLRDAMERHASAAHRVLAICLGRLSMQSSTLSNRLWQSLRHDGPTFLAEKPKDDSFPWKISLADVSCYTLELPHLSTTTDIVGQEKVGISAGLKSKLKMSGAPKATRKTVLELVTTTITVSVVTKALQYKTISRKDLKKSNIITEEDRKTQYFTAGMEFKPTTLKEFVRGPSSRIRKSVDPSASATSQAEVPSEVITIKDGPLISLGVHLHADTPPIIIRLEQDQIQTMSATIHCLAHIHTLLQRPAILMPNRSFTSIGSSHRSLIRSVSEINEITVPSEEDTSEKSELVPIFDRTLQKKRPLKTFFWFQWVVSRATLVLASDIVKLALDIDDIISTVDIQTEYNQLKVKVASASIKHYKRNEMDEWVTGVIGGRVLEAREPTKAEEDTHFLSVTITQAQVSDLPASWKEELHPKLLESTSSHDTMWEVFATLAPLEALVQPSVIDNIITLISELVPRAFCPLRAETENRLSDWQWPYLYLTAGGIRVVVAGEDVGREKSFDDTVILYIGAVNITPHPENPICRRAVNTGPDGGWLAGASGFEGRQYEVVVKEVSVQSTKFKAIALAEAVLDNTKGMTTENPALKWSQRTKIPQKVPILHSVELCCVLAPAMYVGGLLACGPAVELNLVSDCSIEISVDQLVLLKNLQQEFVFDFSLEQDRSWMSNIFTRTRLSVDKDSVCPYANIITNQLDHTPVFDEPVIENVITIKTSTETCRTTYDSGVETTVSSSKTKLTDDVPIKKSVSIAFVETGDASNFLEVFVTMGVIDLSLYVTDDGSPEVIALRPPSVENVQPVTPIPQQQPEKEDDEKDVVSPASSRSLTDAMRDVDIGATMLHTQAHSKLCDLTATFMSPAMLVGFWILLYFLGRRFATISPGDMSAGSGTSTRGTVRLDIERPVQLEVSTDNLRRLRDIILLVTANLSNRTSLPQSSHIPEKPLLYRIKKQLLSEGMESITIHTSQISACGHEGIVGWDSFTLQISASSRPERLNARGLVTALLVAAGSPADRRHVILQPLMMGLELEAYWEAWRRAEGGHAMREPTVRISVEFDDVTVDLRPSELATLHRLERSYRELAKMPRIPTKINLNIYPAVDAASHRDVFTHSSQFSSQGISSDTESCDQFYKDDLRSGAFKILSGGQLPMAYQVMLHGSAVSWRYPHPRAITRLVAFPLPGQEKETSCVLELYNSMLSKWESHTYFKIPFREPKELNLPVSPPETVFAIMWRFRVCEDSEPPVPYEFLSSRFLPRSEPLLIDEQPEQMDVKSVSGVSAEQLSGVLRVDSYFAPRLLPRTKAVLRVANFNLHLHNSLPSLTSAATYLEGYYVSRPLMRTHRVLSVTARSTAFHTLYGSPAGTLVMVDTNLSTDMIDSSTGTMEEIVEEFRLQGGLSDKQESLLTARYRVLTTGIHVALQIPRLRTLQSLCQDWKMAYDEYLSNAVEESLCEDDEEELSEEHEQEEMVVAEAAVATLEGRVSLWVHNSCASAMRVGQEDTEEVVPLGPGVILAYRWRNPTAPKRLRFALAGPTADWHWSSSLPFLAGVHRLKIDTPDPSNSKQMSSTSAFVHVKVEDAGAAKTMHLSGRLVLANMLRATLLYKVRAHCSEAPQWRTLCSGEMTSETVGRSVVCSADCDMVLKIKLRSHNTCWSGDIPLKECPKENVPWLVKVPTEGETQFVSVWCRVVRGRNDGRILATVWPLYVLHSHLPLDTEVLIVTESPAPATVDQDSQQARPPPMLQTSPGRGSSTHLQAPGTTAARHSLSFQYKNIECPVTREAVPLHYGVTDTSVFDKRSPVLNVDDVIKDIQRWLSRSAHNATSKWPYSVVARHWNGEWFAASIQPRCDVTVRYTAVRAGGGCSLEVQLCPVALMCNATPIPLTLRAYDAAPLCKLEPGTAISPPTTIIKKPFFMSVEMGRETFVSSQLQVSAEDPGRYGTPPPGHVALDHATNFAILCNQKVALLTLYYEIKKEINVLGVSTSYVLINRLDTELLVSAVAVPNDMDEYTTLRPKSFKVVMPVKEGSVHGTPLTRFWLRGRWRGGDPSELRTYLCLSLSSGMNPMQAPVPIRLGVQPLRRAVALIDSSMQSVPIVVTQIKNDNRWLVVVAPDPCPQFLVHNHTRLTLAVAQPVHFPEEPSTSHTVAVTECAGTRWCCMVPPNAAVHYSTPAHCARYPPEGMPATSVASCYLTFAKGKEELEQEWCSPVVAADGEHLLQYYGGITIKLRVRTHPHSTLLELQDVDQNDISASDIRRRLLGVIETEELTLHKEPVVTAVPSLERVGAACRVHSPGDVNVSGSMYESKVTHQLRSPSTGKGEDSDYKFKKKRSLSQDGVYWSTSMEGSNSRIIRNSGFMYASDTRFQNQDLEPELDQMDETAGNAERFRCVIAGVSVELSAASDVTPLLAVHLDRTALLMQSDSKKTKTILSIADAQIDNLQYETGQYDFAVIASTRAEPLEPDRWPPLWNMFAERDTFATRADTARLELQLQHDKWEVVNNKYKELTEVDLRVGTLALYVEDAFIKALVDMSHLLLPSASASDQGSLSEERSIQKPLRLRVLHVHPLDLTLTLHTAVRMYIALDQSPLRLSAFKLHDMMTSAERLTHALTVHYLSAAILGAGWVVGGLELLGAPGALAARLGGATGGVRGVASAAAAALLRSLSAWAGSLARNLDLLAGDEEHARRAAAARRRPPPSFVAGLVAGITNFAINILGAVGGLAHHPLVGVAVGETESGAAALRRGILGALTKPLSATADLVAYAGSGLLRQTGWDPVPEPRRLSSSIQPRAQSGWHRDCVRWVFRMCELNAFTGFEVLVDNAQLQLLVTHKFLIVADPESERIMEMIDFRFCTLSPYQGQIIELCVMQRRQSKLLETRMPDEDEEYQISAAAMARVARYTGAEGTATGESRVLSLLPPPGRSHALHAVLAAALHHNCDSHFPML